jgi:hypothetical protein
MLFLMVAPFLSLDSLREAVSALWKAWRMSPKQIDRLSNKNQFPDVA